MKTEQEQNPHTFDQSVLVGGGGAGQHSQFGPDLVDAFLFDLEGETGKTLRSAPDATGCERRRHGAALPAHLALLVAYSAVELFALQADEVVAGLQDAALGGDGPRRIDVVARHHPHRDACALALPDGFWDLWGGGNAR